MPLVVILSVVATAIISAFNIRTISQIWIIPASFAAGVIIFSLLFWLVLWLTCFYIPVMKEYKKPSRTYQKLLNIGYWFLCTAARIKPHITGLDKIPKDRRFLFVSNHLSRFDNMVQSIALRKTPLAFVSKPSNFKIPVGRHLITRCCYIPIDRDNPKNAMKAINRAAELISSDYVSVGIYPEGHRGTGCDLQEFRAGCFKVAQKAKCPIVVATIFGTEKIHKNFPFHRTDVYLDILECVEIGSEKTTEVAPKIKKIMQENLNNYKEK